MALREAASGLGARVTTTLRVVLPAAVSGLMAAIIVGFSRAIGETMVVTIASGGGDTSLFDLSLKESGGTITGAMAALGFGTDQVAGNDLAFQSLYFLGALLFLITLGLNFIGNAVVRRMQSVTDVLVIEPKLPKDSDFQLKRKNDVWGTTFKVCLFALTTFAVLFLAVLIGVMVVDGWPVLSNRLTTFLSQGFSQHSAGDAVFGKESLVYPNSHNHSYFCCTYWRRNSGVSRRICRRQPIRKGWELNIETSRCSVNRLWASWFNRLR